MQKKKMINVNVIIPEEFKREVERIAKKRDIPQQQVFRMMLDLGLEIHRDMEKAGVVAAVDFLYFAKRTIKDRLKSKGPIQLELPL